MCKMERLQRFNNRVVFPHPDFPTINPLILRGSNGLLNRLLKFSFHDKSVISIFLN